MNVELPHSGPASASAGSEQATKAPPVLQVNNLSVEFNSRGTPFRVVEDVTFAVDEGSTFGLVGESGSGKTVTSLAMLGLIRPPVGRVATGSIRLSGRELVGLPEKTMSRIRGKEIAMIFQEPRRNLDPAFTVGDQIAETIRRHLGLSRKESYRRAVEMLDLVRISSARKKSNAYPHEFSGGMAQRVMLAIALACSPKVLIADEPTTALDVTVQDQVLTLLKDLQAELGLSIVFISHDLGVVARMCDRVAVMYAGQIVEEAETLDLYLQPQHPYTAALLGAIPDPTSNERLTAIPGVVPPAQNWPAGCRFHPRCAFATDTCVADPPEFRSSEHSGSAARCHYSDVLDLRGIDD